MRKWLVYLVLTLLALYFGPGIGQRIFGWGPGDEVRPPRGRLVDIGEGRELSVHNQGEGRPIILIHGWSSNAADWDLVPGLLAAQGHRVVTYDRAGYGYSTRLRSETGNFSVASDARDLIALMDALGIQEATLVGWSFGGGIAQRVAIDFPRRVSHLALVGSMGPRPEIDTGELPGLAGAILGSPLAAPVLEWTGHVPPLSYKMVEESVAQAFSGARNVPTGWTIRTQAMLTLPGTSAAIAGEIQRVEDVPDPLRIIQPTLVLHGSDDLLVPYVTAEALHAGIPNSGLDGIVGGSHMLPVTHPEWLANHVNNLVGSEYREGQLPGDLP